ncbi:sucrose-6-phosphate hydrolase [Lactiplantibacillus daowaiensis]|uniref:Sucrose-6-phosphate hydrolase n=1 Tax=Lactiplantibacillus daowaiensis TaxID=2559918 RepID=A0ABW1S3G9_9LACO|nr:sucrose-6-phosphate hydrolase [Lactiplantibacillus daowaiensis]
MTVTSWTTAMRYRPYAQWPAQQLIDLRAKIAQSHWRFGYHIQPTTGLLNDPNGFTYFNGQWQLFYQSFPFGPVHGLKSWVHLVSDDLLHWQNLGRALTPDSPLDQQGVYSGSALPVEDRLFLMYTGNVRDQQWQRHPKQNGAWLTTANQVTKLVAPLISDPPTGVTEHFRDPQLIRHGEWYYAILGAQKQDQTGHILVYRARDVTGPWHIAGELTFGDQALGYMVECPNLVFIDDRPVLTFCPQGISPDVLASDNRYPNAYVVGTAFDWEHLRIVNPSPLRLLDAGFDVYATQAFNAPDGQVLAVSWIGLPDTTYPSDQEGWANGLSMVKTLRLCHGELRQTPVTSLETLRTRRLALTTESASIPAQSELQFTIPADQQGTLTIVMNQVTGAGLTLTFDTVHGKLVVDRSAAGAGVAVDYGTSRTATLPVGQAVTGQLLLDNSVFELYLNDGATVLTGRLFPPAGPWQLTTTGFTVALNLQGWQLASINQD